MKKVELHLHLDGSIDINLANQIMGKDVTNELINSNSKSLTDYLKKFDLPIRLLQGYSNIATFSYLLAKKLEEDEVIYAEVRFCPLFHLEECNIDEIISAMKSGFEMVPSIKINIIFCMMRNYKYEENLKIIELTKKYLGNGVCGIDLAGDEANYKTADFKSLFDLITSWKIPFTIHAGEADSYQSVDDALNFGAKRIGHGISSVKSNSTIDRLVKKNVVLEICPTSNIDTYAVDDISKHPIKELVDKGVKVCINTDNRTVSNTTLENEYSLLKSSFGFTDDDFIKFNLNAIDCAFISNEEKEELKRELLS